MARFRVLDLQQINEINNARTLSDKPHIDNIAVFLLKHLVISST